MTNNKANFDTKVLVTGASGFIAIHCVQQLLDQGYKVRGTVRSLSNENKVKPLKLLRHSENLELVETNLLEDDGWDKAVEGCTYVLHIASPFPIVSDESTIRTAVDGTLRVLKAAAKEPTVKKVVLTSSCVAISDGHSDMTQVFDEKTWTNVESPLATNYAKSKTLAERAAWDYVKNDEVKYKLTAINPSLVVGPLLHYDEGSSVQILRKFMNHEMPALPPFSLGLVDVRDVAAAHLKAMCEPKSNGERIMVTALPAFYFKDIAETLKKEFGPQGYSIPTIQVPYPLLWLYSFFSSETREILCRCGPRLQYDNSKSKQLLGIKYIEPSESLIAMAYSLIERGIVPKKRGYKGPPAPSSPKQS